MPDSETDTLKELRAFLVGHRHEISIDALRLSKENSANAAMGRVENLVAVQSQIEAIDRIISEDRTASNPYMKRGLLGSET